MANPAHKNRQPEKLKLRHLFSLKSSQWLIAWAVGLVTLFATVGLLSVSGWFISAAALAGLVTVAGTALGAISFDFFRPAAVIRAFAITRTAGRYGERLASHHAVLGLLTDLRCKFFSAISQQKLTSVSELVSSADAMQRLTHDIDQLDELPLRFWAPWLWAVILQAVLLSFVAWFSLPLAKVIVLPLLLAGVCIPAVGVVMGRKIAQTHTQLAETRRRDLLNPLTASTSLILWQQWQPFQDQFHGSDATYNQTHLRQHITGQVLNTLQQLLLAVVIILLIWQGYALVATGSLTVPMLLAYVLAVLGMYEILLPLASSYTAYGFAVASRDRLNALIDNQPTSDTDFIEENAKKPFPTSALTFTAKGITAKFPNALHGVEHASFTLQTGDVLFVKGRSGAGKSTLLHALAGELPVSKGTLTLNDVTFDSVNTESEIGYLAQQLDIFDLSLSENLRVGNAEATDEMLWNALAAVNLADWANSQPLGLQTQLGEYGTAASGGQARRIALARLLLKPRKILLLDEPFAGLDADNAAHVYKALKAQQNHGLLIIVSHHFVPEGVDVLIIE